MTGGLRHRLAVGSRSNAGSLLALTALSWLIYRTFGEGFLNSYNLFTLSQLAAETAIIGFSQLVVVVIGRLNLAVGAIGVAVAMSTGWMVGIVGVSPVLGLLLGLVLGSLLGALLGLLELATGLSSFIVTLAMSSIYVGIVLIASGGAAISSITPSITGFSDDTLFIPAVSMLVVPALLITALLSGLYHRSTWGWEMLAVGANQRAAELSGVGVPRIVVGSFALSGTLSAVAALIEMSRVASSLPSLGISWLLPSLVVPILGGTVLSGGSVSIAGALVAALFVESINSGLVSLDVPAYWQQFAQSIVLLIAVVAGQRHRARAGSDPTTHAASPAPAEGVATHVVR